MNFKLIFATPLMFAAVVSAQNVGAPALEITGSNRTISVSASGHAEADAEIAEIHIGYTTYGPTLPAAYKAASETSNAIVKALTDAGAQKSEIQSQSQNVSRLQDYEMKTQKGMKFSVQQSWTVSVAPKEAALILDAAIEAGANQSGDINWRMKDSSALELEAIHQATQHALAMAGELAKTMGVTMVKPLYATNSVESGVVMPRMDRKVFAMAAAAPAPPPLAIETQRVQSTANVQIIYGIE